MASQTCLPQPLSLWWLDLLGIPGRNLTFFWTPPQPTSLHPPCHYCSTPLTPQTTNRFLAKWLFLSLTYTHFLLKNFSILLRIKSKLLDTASPSRSASCSPLTNLPHKLRHRLSLKFSETVHFKGSQALLGTFFLTKPHSTFSHQLSTLNLKPYSPREAFYISNSGLGGPAKSSSSLY